MLFRPQSKIKYVIYLPYLIFKCYLHIGLTLLKTMVTSIFRFVRIDRNPRISPVSSKQKFNRGTIEILKKFKKKKGFLFLFHYSLYQFYKYILLLRPCIIQNEPIFNNFRYIPNMCNYVMGVPFQNKINDLLNFT